MIRPATRCLPECLVATLGMALIGVAVMTPGMALGDHSPPAVQATARQVLADGYFQSQPPGRRDSEAQAVEAEPAGTAERRASNEPLAAEPLDLRSRSAAAQIGIAFLWAMVAIAGLLFAVQTFRLLRSRWRRSQPTGDAPATVHSHPAEADEPPLAAAERLAQAGQTGDAVRRLLLGALEQLRRRAGGSAISPSRTAREILRAAMPARARAALSILVEAEERGRFGGHLVGPAAYRACRACYMRFCAWLGTPAA